MVGPMARPEARGLGPGLGLKYENVLRAGPDLDIIVAGRAGPGLGLIIQFADRAPAGSAQLLWARAGLGLKSYLRAGPGPRFQARAGPYIPYYMGRRQLFFAEIKPTRSQFRT